MSIPQLPKKESVVTTKDIKVPTRAVTRKAYLVTKDPELKPTSFRFIYNEKWLIEDTRHFHKVLRDHGCECLPHEYNDKKVLNEKLKELKIKRRNKPAHEKDADNFAIESEQDQNDDMSKTIDQVLYDDMKAKYVKVLSRKPYKIVYSDRRFCQNESLPARTITKMANQGIDISSLKRTNSQAYYDLFVRCYDRGIYEYQGKYYCKSHYRDVRFGRNKRDSDLDW